MAEDIDTVVKGLSDLQKVSKYTGQEFQGFAKNLVAMADATNQSGRRWTIFSRLVSGTPIWKVQNYIRGILGVLGEFNQSAISAAEAQTKQSQATTDQIKGFRTLNKEMKVANEMSKFFIQGKERAKKATGAELAELMKTREEYKEKQDTLMDVVKETERYNFVSFAGGKRQEAETAAMIEMNKQYKVQEKMMRKIQKEAKIQYAFDESRIEVAKKLAKERAIANNPNLEKEKLDEKRSFANIGKRLRNRKRQLFINFAVGKGESDEKKAMKRDQKKAVKVAKKDAKRAKAIFSKTNMATALMPIGAALLPLKGILKLTKAATPFTKDARKFRIKMLKFSARTMKVLDFFFKYMMLGIVAIGAVMVGFKYLQQLYDILKEFGVVDRIKELGKELFSILADVYSILGDFFSGDYQAALDKLNPLLDKTIKFLLKTLGVLLDVGFLALVAGFKLVGDFVVAYLNNDEFRNKLNKVILKAGMVIAAFLIVKYLIGQALVLAGIAALPLLLGVVILAGAFTLFKYFEDAFGGYFQQFSEAFWGIFDFIKGVRSWLSDKLKKLPYMLVDAFNQLADRISQEIAKRIPNPKKSAKNAANKALGALGLPMLANGGKVTKGGMAIVGEAGAEVVKLPTGSEVFSNKKSQQAMGNTTNINITINARDTSDAELRRIATKIGGMVNSKINRTSSFSTFGG